MLENNQTPTRKKEQQIKHRERLIFNEQYSTINHVINAETLHLIIIVVIKIIRCS